MRRIHLEFIQQRNTPWVGIIFLVAAFACTAISANVWSKMQAAGDRRQARIVQLERTIKDKQALESKSQSSIDPHEQARRQDEKKVLRTLSYPWNRVFANIEQFSGKDVAILSMAHDQKSGETQLAVEGLDLPALIRFVDQMNEAEDSKRWYIASYQIQFQNNPATVRANFSNK